MVAQNKYSCINIQSQRGIEKRKSGSLSTNEEQRAARLSVDFARLARQSEIMVISIRRFWRKRSFATRCTSDAVTLSSTCSKLVS